MKVSVSVAEAREIISRFFPAGKEAKVDILKAQNLVLAESVESPVDLPYFDNAAMDGYVVAHTGEIKAGLKFPVKGKVVPGDSDLPELAQGDAVEITTGALIPPGGTTVIPLEQVERVENVIRVKKMFFSGQNIRRKGEVLKAGEILLPSGTRLGPSAISLLAMAGISSAFIWRLPKVGIATTGSELVDFRQSIAEGKIRDSNMPLMQCLLEQMGIRPEMMHRFSDDVQTAIPVLREMLSSCEIILLSGGVSVGGVDWVKQALANLGVEAIFWRVKQRPGGPLFFGIHPEGKWVFGLPGNPVSTAVAFYEYVYPFLRAFCHQDPAFLPSVPAILIQPIRKKLGRYEFWGAILNRNGETFFASSSGVQQSHYLTTLSNADGLLCLPEQKELFEEGEKVEVHIFPENFSQFLSVFNRR